MLLVRKTCFDSGYMFCISYCPFGRMAPIFYGEVDSEPEVFFSVLTQNGELCSVDASFFSLVAHLALGKLDTTFTSFTWPRCVMMDSIFPRSARHFPPPLRN